MRVVSELHLLEIARQQALEPSSWERGNWILLLGAIGDPEGIPILARIIRTRTESVGLREAAIRSLGAIGRHSTIMGVALFSYLKWPRSKRFGSEREWEDSEIEAMRPRRGGLRLYGAKPSEELSHLSIETVTSVASAKNEPVSLRKTALRALRRLADTDVVEVVGRVLLDEWENYGTEGINVLAEIPHDKSVAVFRQFALMMKVDATAQLMSVQALADMEIQSAVAALREISEKAPDENVRVAALESVKVLADKVR
jgi:HEAT repeat protein